MEKLYRETKANLLELGDMLTILEKSIHFEEVNSNKQKLNSKLNEITNSIDQLDILVSKEPATRRYDSKMKIDQIKYDVQHFRAAFNTIVYRKDQRFLEEKRRDELLKSATSSLNGKKSDHIQLYLDNDQNELRHHNRLSKTSDEMDRMIDHGQAIIGSLKSQSDLLKDVKRKILSAASTLGLSNTLIRMIERRTTSDKYILYGGMIITCIIMFLAVRYLI